MAYEGKSRRLRERVKLALPVRIECRESADYRWTEVSRLIDVTPFGAGFTITRQTEVGRLLLLTLPLPRQLRSFDHAEDQYKVWALVRNVRPPGRLALPRAEAARFEVGTAFVGKRAPASYEHDPSLRYDIQTLTPEGNSYALVEWRAPAQEASAGAGAERAVETRLAMPLDVVVEAFDERGVVEEREQTVTENISRHGASVWTTLGLGRGRFVRLTSVAQRVSITAVVRARRAGPDGVMRLHLEFVDREWPLEGLE